MNIYPIKNQIIALQNLLESGEADDESISLLLRDNQLEFKDACIESVLVMKNVEHTITALKRAEDEFKEKRKTLEANIEKTKNRLMSTMEEVGVTEITHNDGLFKIKIKECPPHVSSCAKRINRCEDGTCFLDTGKDYFDIDAVYIRSVTKLELDKNKIAEDLKKGIEVPTCWLEKTKKLEIK